VTEVLNDRTTASVGEGSAGATLRSAADLVAAGLAAPERQTDIAAVGERYAIAIPPALAALIDLTDPVDPIARQFIPDVRELDRHPAERDDPIGDDLKSPVKGLVHRYPDRVLLKLASVCAVYCRFCFRRETVGQGAAALGRRELRRLNASPTLWSKRWREATTRLSMSRCTPIIPAN
jgi:lysine 2,3-aminomutase